MPPTVERVGEYALQFYSDQLPQIKMVQDRSSWDLWDCEADGTLDLAVEQISDTHCRRRPVTKEEQDLYHKILEQSKLYGRQ